jgi:hypothetical protein
MQPASHLLESLIKKVEDFLKIAWRSVAITYETIILSSDRLSFFGNLTILVGRKIASERFLEKSYVF